MANIATKYMGLQLASPIMIGAGPVSRKLENIKKAEDAGAGALVIYSLFQEQIEREIEELESALMVGSYLFPEALTYFPLLEHSGAREHIMWVEKARNEVRMPLIGSINAISRGNWIDYARQLEEAGCDALELNMYALETDISVDSQQIEKRILEIVQLITSEINIPVAVKLSPWYTSVANMSDAVIKAGARGVVMFNRFYQPGIDPETETLKPSLDLSRSEDSKMPIRWAAILSGQLSGDIIVSTGIHTGNDVIKAILAGAVGVQVVSAALRNGISHISRMNQDITEWMDRKNYSSLDEFRGKLNQKNVPNPHAFERTQYANIMMGSKEEIKTSASI